MNALSEMRSQSCVEPKQKCKKINVVPGKSVTNLDLAAPLAAEQEQEQDQNEPLDDEINTMIEDEQEEEQGQVSGEENLFEEDLFEEDWVIVQYEGSNCPGIVKKVETGGVEVSVMQNNNGVEWLNKVDQILRCSRKVASNRCKAVQ